MSCGGAYLIGYTGTDMVLVLPQLMDRYGSAINDATVTVSIVAPDGSLIIDDQNMINQSKGRYELALGHSLPFESVQFYDLRITASKDDVKHEWRDSIKIEQDSASCL